MTTTPQQTDVERAIQVVLDSQHAAYVQLLNKYLLLLSEIAALRAERAGGPPPADQA